jgi:hypothetical protein
LTPAVALGQSLHLLVGVPYTAVATPTMWLLLEPFDLLAGCLVLCSIDAVARGLGVSKSRRTFLVVAELITLWNPVVYQWHPEDAFAVAFGLWGLLAASDGRWKRAGWLMGRNSVPTASTFGACRCDGAGETQRDCRPARAVHRACGGPCCGTANRQPACDVASNCRSAQQRNPQSSHSVGSLGAAPRQWNRGVGTRSNGCRFGSRRLELDRVSP